MEKGVGLPKMKKLILGLFTFFILQSQCLTADYSNLKQPDEFTCAPTSSLNLIKNICKTCEAPSLNYMKKLQKTDENGTTAFNLCYGLEKYFKTQNKHSDIRYFGIKKVKIYKHSNNFDLLSISNPLNKNYGAILNIGVYTQNSKGEYVRQWGHYVNLISINDKFIKIIDPYNKNSYIDKLQYQTSKDIKLINKKDNEKYIKADKYYVIKTPLNYLQKNETAIINGVITIKLN